MLQAKKSAPAMPMTVVYDPETQGVKLVTWVEYLKTNKAPWMLQATKSEVAAPELTTVYDPETQGVKLVTWEEYLKTNKAPPLSNYVAMYNPDKKEVELMFWSTYVNTGLHAADVAAKVA